MFVIKRLLAINEVCAKEPKMSPLENIALNYIPTKNTP